MAGGHLDSVHEGPGINDNGSGSSSLIEVAEQMAKLKLPNKLRFAWWGAEEANLVGSTSTWPSSTRPAAPTSRCTSTSTWSRSPNYGLFVYDGDGSEFGLIGPARLGRHRGAVRAVLRRPRHPAGGRALQRPVGLPGVHQQRHSRGWPVHRGRGHQDRRAGGEVGRHGRRRVRPLLPPACDTIDNLSHEALDINSDAIAYVVYLYASGKRAINAG